MSKDQKNNYPLEFKIPSAHLVVESGKSVAQTARDLGINHNTLHGWIEKYSDPNQLIGSNMSRLPSGVVYKMKSDCINSFISFVKIFGNF